MKNVTSEVYFRDIRILFVVKSDKIRIQNKIYQGGFFMNKQPIRVTTNQPGVYQNQKNGKYDVKYSYTEYDPVSNEKKRRTKWVYGINSYKAAVTTLANMRIDVARECSEEVTLEKALELWLHKAKANNYSPASIRNTRQQYNMITKVWPAEVKLMYITEDNYLELISKCRAYGY